MAAVPGPTEPAVLAATKQRLFEPEAEDSYVVADTQFAQEQWVDDRPISPETKSILAPFNHVALGSGYPDLVGVGRLDGELLAVDRIGEQPPLIAIEAKGYTGGGVDVERGILQAYDRLHEANVAYATAPTDAISHTDRTLASELNVGVLGVDDSGELQVLERPRVVGNRTTGEASAIRFQASAQGVAEKSFGLNHPKNYLGVPVAAYHDGDTRGLVEDHVVGAVDDAIRGASFLDLVDTTRTPIELTSLGEEVIRFVLRNEGSIDAALARFEGWQRSRRRFIDDEPLWGELLRRVVFAYPATELLVAELQQRHDDLEDSPTLVELVCWLHEHHPTFAVELFIRGTEAVRERVLTGDGDLRQSALTEGSVYHSPTVFQLKAMLYHAGILTERGAEPTNLSPTEDIWELRERLQRWR